MGSVVFIHSISQNGRNENENPKDNEYIHSCSLEQNQSRRHENDCLKIAYEIRIIWLCATATKTFTNTRQFQTMQNVNGIRAQQLQCVSWETSLIGCYLKQWFYAYLFHLLFVSIRRRRNSCCFTIIIAHKSLDVNYANDIMRNIESTIITIISTAIYC